MHKVISFGFFPFGRDEEYCRTAIKEMGSWLLPAWQMRDRPCWHHEVIREAAKKVVTLLGATPHSREPYNDSGWFYKCEGASIEFFGENAFILRNQNGEIVLSGACEHHGHEKLAYLEVPKNWKLENKGHGVSLDWISFSLWYE